jgi:hypothetical protein
VRIREGKGERERERKGGVTTPIAHLDPLAGSPILVSALANNALNLINMPGVSSQTRFFRDVLKKVPCHDELNVCIHN